MTRGVDGLQLHFGVVAVVVVDDHPMILWKWLIRFFLP